jgi:hypothetical protein
MAGLGISRGGIVAQPAGGAPPGDSTNFAAVADWAALSTVPGTRRENDQAPVIDADGSGSPAIARYSGSQWELIQGAFATATLMEAFPNPVYEGATCTITATTGPEVYRYQNFGGSVYYWAHSSVPDTLTRQAWGIGTEAVGSPGDPVGTLAGQGYTISTTGANSSVAPSSGETLLTGGPGGGNNALLTVTGLSPVAGTVVYMRAFVRAGTAGTLGRGTQIGDNTQASRMYQIGAGGLDLYGADGVTAVTGGTSRVSTSLPAAAGTPALLEILDRGATLMTTVRLDGVIVLQFRRNLVTTSAFSAVRWLALQSAVMGIRNHMVATV